MGGLPALEIDHVTQRFSLRHEKTLRGLFVTKVLRRYETSQDFTALDDIDLRIDAGTTVGLIGHNGSGKSTLLKIIGGVLTPTRGQVRRRGRLAALLELGAGFHHDLTGRENVYLNAEVLGIPRSIAGKRFDEIVDFSGVEQFIDTPMKFYSSGMFVRLGFAVAIHADPDILLVDEVLAVGDEAFQHKCLDVVRRFQDEGRTIVLVTHDMRQVEDFCNRAVLLDHGSVVAEGIPPAVVADFRERLNRSESEAQVEPAVRVAGVEVSRQVDDAEGVSVKVRADFEGRAPRFVGTARISTRDGTGLAEVSTEQSGLRPVIDGHRRINFEFRDLPLAPGVYRVTVTAAEGDDAKPVHADSTQRFVIAGREAAVPLRARARAAEAPA